MGSLQCLQMLAKYAPSKYFTSLFVKKMRGKKRRIQFQSTCQNCLATSKWAQSDHPFWRSRAACSCLERPGSSAHLSWAAWGNTKRPNITKTMQSWHVCHKSLSNGYSQVTCAIESSPVNSYPNLPRQAPIAAQDGISVTWPLVQSKCMCCQRATQGPSQSLKKIKPPCALCRFVAFWKFPNSPKTSLSCPPSAKITRFWCHATSLVYPSASNGRWKASTCPELGRIRSNELCLAS